MLLQRSEEWHNQRLGRFTASRISELLGIKGLNESGKNLAFEKATEIVFGRDPDWEIESWDMKRGTALEPEAFALFQSIMARKFIPVQECFFFPNGENGGASPDGIVGSSATLQIKCPRPLKLFNLIKDGIAGIESDHIDQMQDEMRCTNSEHAYYFNYCIWKGKELHHTIIVPRNEERIKLIEERIEEAAELRDQFVEQLTHQKQF